MVVGNGAADGQNSAAISIRIQTQKRLGDARLAQRDARQFGGVTEPKREAGPQRGTVVHVQRHPVDVVTARNKAGVGARGQPVEPEDQSAVRVSGQLESHSELRSVPRVARLVIEQDDGDGFGSAFEDRGKVADRLPGAARRPVSDAGENQLTAVAIENDVPIL
jgi:hypothetical protein